jgi:O-acetyl-ADP-ribose deacetylase (regulator of RNase III)
MVTSLVKHLALRAAEADAGRYDAGRCRMQTAPEIIQADITTLALDAIVNAANPSLLGGGGVDGAIHRAAGPGLLAECAALPEIAPRIRCPTGECRLTAGHRLPARYVIHTVGPVWHGGDHGEADKLSACYGGCVRLALDRGIRSIAFPAISCGVYGYPLDAAAAIAVRSVRVATASVGASLRVVFCCYGPDATDAFRQALANDGEAADPRSSGTTRRTS